MPIVRTFLLLRPSVGKAAVGCLSSSSNLWLVLIIRRRRKTNLRFNPQLAFPLVWFLFLLLQPFGWSPFLHSWYSTFGWEGKVKKKKQIREPDHDFFEVKGDVRRLVFNQSCSSNTNRLVSFMVWITNLLSSPFIQPSVGHFGNLISSHEVLPKCMSRRRMKGEERKGKDYTRDDWIQPLTGHWRPNFSRTNLMIQTFGRLEKLSTVGSRHVIFILFRLRLTFTFVSLMITAG